MLAAARPHLYVHLHLRPTKEPAEEPTARDAINSLDDPEFGLWPGSKAALTGTLMRIVATRRESGGRLILTVTLALTLALALTLTPTLTLT